jgi:hypothetical protein
MTEKHPDELALLSYVEEELGHAARQEVAEHLVGCRTCADQVRRLEAGRDALRAAPALELPDARRAEILSTLPDRPDPWKFLRPVRRALVVAAPVAAAAAVVGVFILAGTQLDLGGGDDDAGGGDAASADTGAADQSGGGIEEAAPTVTDAPTVAPDARVVVRVQGPAAEVEQLLENEGIQAEVASAAVVRADGRPGEIRAALSGRPRGNVAVYAGQ